LLRRQILFEFVVPESTIIDWLEGWSIWWVEHRELDFWYFSIFVKLAILFVRAYDICGMTSEKRSTALGWIPCPLGETTHRARITPPLAPMIHVCRLLCEIKERIESTFLELAVGRQPRARRYIVCFVGKMRRFVYDAGGPRETVRNKIHTKPRDVTILLFKNVRT
jgi:hypothetical protein